MSLPGNIGVGLFSTYGIGSNTSVAGVIAPTGFLFSTIYNIWNGNNTQPMSINVGDSALYKESDIVCRLAWANGTYSLIELEKIRYIEPSDLP